MTDNHARARALAVLSLVRQQEGDPSLERAQAVTVLVRRGIATGTAQRLLDEQTDIRIGTAVDAARKLRVPVERLLGLAAVPQSGDTKSTPIEPAATSVEPLRPQPTLAQALPVVLDAIASAAENKKLRAALLGLMDDDTPLYRQRIAELLGVTEQPAQETLRQKSR